MTGNEQLIQQIFEKVVRLSPEEREVALAKECGDKAEVRLSVVDLLAAYDASSQFSADADVQSQAAADSERGPASVTTDHEPNVAPDVIIAGRYALQEKIGEGGMGEVWIAKQTEPVKRKVALKLLKVGMDSKAVLRRFEQERQALALMDHPNIARVIDGGVTSTGRPFFVMELVKGAPVHKFCDTARLTPQQRLELFIPICQGVQHAHHKGIVHRDLKPANIIVTEIDGKPVPKIIDFGVAKAISGKLTEETMDTQFGAVIGTLEYMAPEQAGATGEDVDTRADIYSLGVVLYELLTGLRPFDGERLKQAALTEMLRIVRDEEPAKPSTRLSSSDSLPSMAALRKIDPGRLTALLHGELDWIVLKCLEKHRDRRYDSASGLARDIERYLTDEPVEARPASSLYRFKKFIHRNKGTVVAASLILLALLGGFLGTTWGLIRAETARRDADAAWRAESERAEKERLAKVAAKKAQALAESETRAKNMALLLEAEERKYAEAIANFVRDDFLALTSVEGQIRFDHTGTTTLSKDTTLRTLLDRAADKLAGRKDLAPRIEAELRWIIGISYRGMGEYSKAIEFLEKGVDLCQQHYEEGEWKGLIIQNALGVAYSSAGQHDKSLMMYEKLVPLARKHLGEAHPNTLQIRFSLADAYRIDGQTERSLLLAKTTYELCKATYGDDDFLARHFMAIMAQEYVSAGDVDLALPLAEKALELYKDEYDDDHLDVISCKNTLARVYELKGQLDKALPLAGEVLRVREAQLGETHPKTISVMQRLSRMLRVNKELEKALPLCERALTLAQNNLGKTHPGTLKAMENLADCHKFNGQPDKGLALLEAVVRITKATSGEDHPRTLFAMSKLAVEYWRAGKLDKSIPLFEEVVRLRSGQLGPNHKETLLSKGDLGRNYRDANRLDEAIPVLEEVVVALPGRPDVPWRRVHENRLLLSEIYLLAKQWEKALSLASESLELAVARVGQDHPHSLDWMEHVAVGYLRTNQVDKAIELRRKRLKIMIDKLGEDHSEVLTSMKSLADIYYSSGQLDKAIETLKKRLGIVQEKMGEDHPDTLANINSLGVLCWELRRLDESIPLVERLAKLRISSAGPDHPKTLLAIVNLGVNYLDANRVDEAIGVLEDAVARRPETAVPGMASATLARAYRTAGKWEQSLALAEKNLTVIKKLRGARHAETLKATTELETAQVNLATRVLYHDKFDRAEKLWRAVLESRLGRVDRGSPLVASATIRLAGVLRLSGRGDDADKLLASLPDQYRDREDIEFDTPISNIRQLTHVLNADGYVPVSFHLSQDSETGSLSVRTVFRLRRETDVSQWKIKRSMTPAEFESTNQQSLNTSWQLIVKQEYDIKGVKHVEALWHKRDKARQLAGRGAAMLGARASNKAETTIRQSLALREKEIPDSWQTFNTRSLLGEALLGQQKYDEATTLLLAGYEGLKRREDMIPQQASGRMGEAIERLIKLYQATGAEDQVARWRSELASRETAEKARRARERARQE